jgi:predicted O-methyltransferase YrrM
MTNEPISSVRGHRQKLPFFVGLNSQKILLLFQMLISRPSEFRERFVTALKWRFDRSTRPVLNHTEISTCLTELSSRFAVDINYCLKESGLAEIEEEVTALLNKVRSEASMDVLHSAHPLLARLCYLLVRCIQPSCVVETGVAFGISSAYILKALEVNRRGQLISLDRPPLGKNYRQQVGSAIPSRLKACWHLIEGDSAVELPKLVQKLDRIDMFVHDSLHTERHMTFEFSTVWPLMRAGSLLVSDDIESNCAFLNWSRRSDIAYSAFLQEPDKKPAYSAEAPIEVLPSMGVAIKS